ncbi:MAG: hypothetical protein LQ341_005568 [Variospora aurantia]|nr:MAG: hypothetical protein LQ341_005568 [Variospora aurantia]
MGPFEGLQGRQNTPRLQLVSGLHVFFIKLRQRPSRQQPLKQLPLSQHLKRDVQQRDIQEFRIAAGDLRTYGHEAG